jgi:hypothetical protein
MAGAIERPDARHAFLLSAFQKVTGESLTPR